MCIESELKYNLTLSLGVINLIDEFLIDFTEKGDFFNDKSFPEDSTLTISLDRFHRWAHDAHGTKSYALYMRESTLALFRLGDEMEKAVEGATKLNKWSVDISTVKVKTPSMNSENLFYFHNMLLGVILFAYLKQVDDILFDELCELSTKLDDITNLLSGAVSRQPNN